MNKRISQLIKQSYVTIRTPSGEESTYFSQEKFAELIVKECTKLIEQSIEDDEYWSRATGAESIMAIEDHFGVEQ